MSAGIRRDALRPESDPMVIAAFESGRHADDIYIVQCPWCSAWSYYNQGSHAECRSCERDLRAQIPEMITIADFWDDAPYPCDLADAEGPATPVQGQAENASEIRS